MADIYFSVVIPTYNESRRIKETLRKVLAYCQAWQKKTGRNFEIIVADDGSADDTSAKVSEFSQIKIIRNPINHGKGAAVKIGMLNARGKYRLFTDADNSTPIEEMDKFWPILESGAKVVIGSRALSDSRVVVAQKWTRRSLGRLANKLIQLFAVPGINDTQCGFKVFEKDAAEKLFSRQKLERWGFDFELLAMARHWDWPIVEVPVNWYNSVESRVQPFSSALATLIELFWIRWRLWRGKYEL